MLTIAPATAYGDFAAAAEMGRAFGAWDAEQARAYGLDEDVVLALFHDSGIDSLTAQFTREKTALMIARWDNKPAGCLGFEPLEGSIFELKNFYVDAAYRGRNIGRSLLGLVLDRIKACGASEIVLHTTVYMLNAITLYSAFGFERCEPFREVPDFIRHTEVFMRRPA